MAKCNYMIAKTQRLTRFKGNLSKPFVFRNPCESLFLPEQSERLCVHDKMQLEVEDPACDLGQIYDDLRALQRENWTLSPESTWQANGAQIESQRARNTDTDAQTSPGVLSEVDTGAPPIPPRSSSWNLSTPETELHIPESPMTTMRKCHSPCVLVDKKCSSPSIVRKFEAMLQENEGKVFVDGVIASCSVPANSKCNIGCCHNRWSCDTSKFSNSKLSAYGTVQKSFSEVNIRSAAKDLHSDYSPGVRNLKSSELQLPLLEKECPVDLLLSHLEVAPASPNLQGSRRNIMLEQKTAEFNRTLFQAEMGRGVEEQDGLTVTAASSVGCPSVHTVLEDFQTRKKFQPHCSSIMSGHPEATSPLFILDSTIQKPEVQQRGVRCCLEDQQVRMKQETSCEFLPEQPQVRLSESPSAASHSFAHHCEAKHKVPTASSPSRNTQHSAGTEDLFSQPVLPANTQPGQNVEGSGSKNENPHGSKPQLTRVALPPQQLSTENKQRQMTQPRHASVSPSQSDSSRPGPRMMNDHPWKPLTLAAYPRPEGSRSNYGAVERILKNYESAAQAKKNQGQQNEPASSPNLIVGQEENTELDMLDMDPLTLPPILRQTSHSTQLSSHSAKGIQLIVQVGGVWHYPENKI